MRRYNVLLRLRSHMNQMAIEKVRGMKMNSFRGGIMPAINQLLISIVVCVCVCEVIVDVSLNYRMENHIKCLQITNDIEINNKTL